LGDDIIDLLVHDLGIEVLTVFEFCSVSFDRFLIEKYPLLLDSFRDGSSGDTIVLLDISE
jgi:hypothetical protein